MGLDVYLIKYNVDDPIKYRQQASLFEEEESRLYDEMVTISFEDMARKAEHDAQYKKYQKHCAKLKEEMGIEDSKRIYVEIPSVLYPEHGWKIGYFRSSYNGSGFNHIMRMLVGEDLYTIFDSDRDEYEQQYSKEQLGQIKQKAITLKQKVMTQIKEFPYACFESSHFGNSQIESEEDALNVFKKHLLEHKDKDWNNYSNFEGEFSLKDHWKVHAVLHGKQFGHESTYIIYERDEKEFEYYLQAFDIIVENIDYLLAQPDLEKYYFAWSG
jgi:hypothetical protein